MKHRMLTMLLVIVMMLTCFPLTALAWDSYSGVAEDIHYADPLHEDITQMAFGRLVSSDGYTTPTNLLYADNETAYSEIVKYLRMGTYWNDVAASDVTEFVAAYLARDYIAGYKKARYDSAYDVGEHLYNSLYYPNWYTRAMVRFSHNGCGDFLHGMLGYHAKGYVYLSQQEMKAFTMQWLEVAYKFARGDTLTAEQQKLLNFVDPYRQIEGSPYTMGYPSGITANGDADAKMTYKQGKIRALGMMCHTLEDSYNPAHVIRSYSLSGAGQIETRILAFGQYETQAHHKNYDHISPLDAARRTTLKGVSGELSLAKSNPSTFGEMQNFNTMGLTLAGNAAYRLLSFYAQGADWATVQTWLENDVYKTEFVGGSSVIEPAGRRVVNLSEMHDSCENLSYYLIKNFGDKAKPHAEALASSISGLQQYQNNVLRFYASENTAGPVYHTSYENDGQTYAKRLIDDLYAIVSTATADELRKIPNIWWKEDMQSLLAMTQSVHGIVQEFSWDIDETADADYVAKAIAISAAFQPYVDALPEKPKDTGAGTGVSTGVATTDYNSYSFTNAEGEKLSNGDVRFVVPVDCSKFVSAAIDGTPLDKAAYAVECGSTILTLHADCIAALTQGSHQLTVTFIDGKAQTAFTVGGAPEVSAAVQVPATGTPALLPILLSLCGAWLLGMAALKRRRMEEKDRAAITER